MQSTINPQGSLGPGEPKYLVTDEAIGGDHASRGHNFLAAVEDTVPPNPSTPQSICQPRPSAQSARPFVSTKTRLARFLHFARSAPPGQPDIWDSTSSNVVQRLRGANSTSSVTEFQAKLLSRPLQTRAQWEQQETLWAPGFELNRDKESPGQVDEEISSQHSSNDSAPFTYQPGPSNASTSRLSTATDKSVGGFTPLEQQWLDFKRKNPGVVLLMEVGYKIRLFGTDAVLASKVLSIGHLSKSKLESAFFPKTSLSLHLKRLVMAGHKVGIITQSETKALKKHQENNKTLFERHLSKVYSLSTWTEFDNDSDLQLEGNFNSQSVYQTWIMSLYEERTKKRGDDALKDKVKMSMVALCPQSGDVIWDCWIDGRMRSRLETLLLYFTPHEIVLPLNGLSRPSENLINWFIRHRGAVPVKTRLESIEEDFDLKKAFAFVTAHCQLKKSSFDSHSSEPSRVTDAECVSSSPAVLLPHIIELPDRVLMPLAGLIFHMKSYHLESVFRQPTCFKSFASQSHMILNANTLSNLEIFQNSTDGKETGSLMWILDHTKTPMGKRLLKQWIGKPLVDFDMLKERCEAVHEVVSNKGHPLLFRMKHFLQGRLSDLEKSLVRIQYGKCTEVELLKFLDILLDISLRFTEPFPTGSIEFQSDVLTGAFRALSSMKDKLLQYRSELNGPAIRKGDFSNMFVHAEEQYPRINEMKDCLACVDLDLDDHLVKCREILNNPKLQYLTVGSDELLFEVRTKNIASVPTNWTKITSTKAVHRFRTLEAQAMLEERQRYRDLLRQHVQEYFHAFLCSFEEDYEDLRNIINQISILDCLFSLATASTNNNYCQPVIVDYPHVDVKGARHPTVEQITNDPFVENDVYISRDYMSTMILTGNNMGGKSITSKMVACIIIMAQIGCHVPAEHATIGIFDACFTRMGMSDELGRGRSSFMVELNDTSSILKAATPRSLVIFDELGYGTSTHDGTAIASAVLHHLVTQIKCFTLFITHYPQMNEIALTHPCEAKSFYMNYIERNRTDGTPDITFLYKLTPGVARESHGINVARLAGFSPSILQTAHAKSCDLKEQAHQQDLYLK
ncbi:hypothetical protein CROQUDRAFT_42418 [Cronartium quercuum f. sp. fusiforme G11]|uniref:MutS protein homolog 3 n=1 Tax=Cronartium quercuum f. sp. fusiforme G11 TaxID=708437 RepID=A0A9P6NIR0_9BASI|nr:hypothetical protein CROQUDRAFT_42418 [Cronartium quercuum f. sp. fusiforme G11]